MRIFSRFKINKVARQASLDSSPKNNINVMFPNEFCPAYSQ